MFNLCEMSSPPILFEIELSHKSTTIELETARSSYVDEFRNYNAQSVFKQELHPSTVKLKNLYSRGDCSAG